MFANVNALGCIWIFGCIITFNLVCGASSLRCSPKDFGLGSVVCVCNSTYCDTVEPDTPQPDGFYNLYQSAKSGARLNKTTGKFESIPAPAINSHLVINRNVTFQSIIGFGGAFTDAAGINIASLSPPVQDNLLKSYYHPDGIEYDVARIPMASCDFSTHPYSYDDTHGDLNLTKFSLADEDLKYKIPFLQKAMAMGREVKVFGSPWSAPAWMKTDQKMNGKGSLIGKPGGPYFKAWAEYFVKFLDAYASHNISLWGLTAQNEPTDGFFRNFSFQAMGWSPEDQRDFIKMDLGPKLAESGHSDVKLMIMDDQRLLLPYWADVVLSDAGAAKYISGVAVHWYLDKVSPTPCLDLTHQSYPDKFIFGTEACYTLLGLPPLLGDWNRAEGYAHDILQDLRHWVTGWTDWNIALNLEGGPNWVKNYVDSPIIVDSQHDAFYKQPMFYAMGHFSKFLPSGTKRIGITDGAVKQLESEAFIRGDGSVVIILLNSSDTPLLVTIEDAELGFINQRIPSHSIETITYWTK